METDLERLLPAAVRPEQLYREIAYRRGGPLAAWINEWYDLLARPGESPTAPPEAGDVLVRVALGEPGLGHVAVLSDSSLTPRNSLDPVQVKAERGGPGLYATVIEAGAFPHNRSDRFARRVLDHAGQMPPGQMLLRPKPSLEPHLDLLAPRGDIGFYDSGSNALETVSGPTSSGGSSPTRTTPAMSSPIATPAMAQEPLDASIERGLVLGLWIGLLDSPNNHFGDWPPPWFMRTRNKMLASSDEVPLFPDLQPYWPLQLIENASSYDTNMDLYRLSITKFPVVDGAQLDHRALTRRIRLRINDLINTRYASFKPYDEEERIVWESEDPRGAIVSIDALGPDNFDVMCIESYGDEQAAGWVFATMSTDRHGQHPLSGVRSFGIRKAEAGWEFFTQAIDRWHGVSSLEANTIGLGPSIQDYLWQSLLSGVATFVNANGGAASRLPIIRRSVPWARLEGSFSRDRIHLGQARAKSLAADRPSEDMEAGTPVEAESLYDGSGLGNDTFATSAHLNSEEGGVELEYNSILDRIRQEMSLRYADPNDPGLVQRRQRLRVLFASVPLPHTRQLHARLGEQPTGDELSRLFHGRLARATRLEMLKILEGRFQADTKPREPDKPVAEPAWVQRRAPLPADAQERFRSALAALKQKIAATTDPRAWRYHCWFSKLEDGGDDRVIEWRRICPRTTGATGTAFAVGGCDIRAAGVDQAEFMASIRSVQDVEQANRQLQFITHLRSWILFNNDVVPESLQLDNFRRFHDDVIQAITNLELWANHPMGGSSAMWPAYRSVKAWIRVRQDDPSSVYSCM